MFYLIINPTCCWFPVACVHARLCYWMVRECSEECGACRTSSLSTPEWNCSTRLLRIFLLLFLFLACRSLVLLVLISLMNINYIRWCRTRSCPASFFLLFIYFFLKPAALSSMFRNQNSPTRSWFGVRRRGFGLTVERIDCMCCGCGFVGCGWAERKWVFILQWFMHLEALLFNPASHACFLAGIDRLCAL